MRHAYNVLIGGSSPSSPTYVVSSNRQEIERSHTGRTHGNAGSNPATTLLGRTSQLVMAPGLNPDELRPWGFNSLSFRLCLKHMHAPQTPRHRTQPLQMLTWKQQPTSLLVCYETLEVRCTLQKS